METAFGRLVRFADSDGHVWYGEAPSITDPATLIGEAVPIYAGTEPWADDFGITNESKVVHEILCPLAATPLFHCVGLNYRRHIEETQSKIPLTPALFNKPPDSLAGPLEVIPIHEECLWLDYEGELCIIIGKTCKNIGPQQDPLDYVLGYTVGNDVSSRYWQAPERSSMQAGYSKSFDKSAPIGPFICSSKVVPDASNLRLTTKVNGELRQDARTDDLLFDVAKIIRYLSRGHTLRPGTVIMTGTPNGVGLARSPPVWLKNDDIVEIEIEKLGMIRNKFSIPKQIQPNI